MKKKLLLCLTVAAGLLFLLSAVMLLQYYCSSARTTAWTEGLKEIALKEPRIADGQAASVPGNARPESDPETEGTGREDLPEPPFALDFELLRQEAPDIIGWLTCEGTAIDYPVMGSRDNADYLRRLPDGAYSYSGSLFADCACSRDFTDPVTVIYGHNMQDDTMLGTLPRYGEQDYYEAHPALWLLTPDGTCLAEVVAACRTTAGSAVYSLPESPEGLSAYVAALAGQSLVEADRLSGRESDRYLLLSTCDYSFSGARFVVLARLQRVEAAG